MAPTIPMWPPALQPFVATTAGPRTQTVSNGETAPDQSGALTGFLIALDPKEIKMASRFPLSFDRQATRTSNRGDKATCLRSATALSHSRHFRQLTLPEGRS